MSLEYAADAGLAGAEYYALVLFAALGMMLMAAADDLIIIFLGLETMSIAVYALAGFLRRDPKSNEAAIKYFLLGAFSTGFLLYGIALIYGATGTIRLEPIRASLTSGIGANPLLLLAMLTMTAGNVIALVQTNIKRMLAYSAIAHAGYVIVGMAAGGGHDAGGAILYYLLAYAFTNLGAFAVVVALERGAEAHDEIADYHGLAREHPGLAAAMALCLLSLTGVPPLAGFVAKFYIFSAALNAGLVWLVIIAVLNSVVSAYYYVGVIVAMYMQEGGVTVERMSRRPGLLISIGVGVAGVIALGIYPQPYMGAAINAFASALGRQPIHTISMLP
jgi:NADH:ubiquinone oxidoreductase subunit 2 (subunit N)